MRAPSRSSFSPPRNSSAAESRLVAVLYIDDVDYLLGVHVGLDHPTGEVVAGIDGVLAVIQFDVEFKGESAHAGLAPNEGHNAVQALVSAAEDMYAIPRHEEGATRANLGNLQSDNASNVIADRASADAEVRGKTTELMEYMRDATVRILKSTADVHECTADLSINGQTPREDSDEELVEIVSRIGSADADDVSSVVRRDNLGASEDFTHLLQAVKANGGAGTFVGIGTDHPGGHHTPTFDVDEASLPIGVDVLSRTALDLLA